MYKPWLPEAAIEYIDRYLQEASIELDDPLCVLEHGAGTSTPWLAKRCDFLLSFETDPKWYSKVGSMLRKERLLDHTMLIFASQIPEIGIKIPHNAPRAYDLVFVDGRGRVKFWERAKKYLKPGGLVVFDDAERTKYRPATEEIRQTFEMVQTFYKPEKPRAYTLIARKPHAPSAVHSL